MHKHLIFLMFLLLVPIVVVAQDEETLLRADIAAAECHIEGERFPTPEELESIWEDAETGAMTWVRTPDPIGFAIATLSGEGIELERPLNFDAPDDDDFEITCVQYSQSTQDNLFQLISTEPLRADALQNGAFCAVNGGELMAYAGWLELLNWGHLTIEPAFEWVIFEETGFILIDTRNPDEMFGLSLQEDSSWDDLISNDESVPFIGRCFNPMMQPTQQITAEQAVDACEASGFSIISEESFLEAMASGDFPSPWGGFIWTQTADGYMLYDAREVPPQPIEGTEGGDIPESLETYLPITTDCEQVSGA